ncbi:MAG: UDP-N-acetylglucosamine 1-carboxyvinyltransferase, partial [Planctomycetota bacterium]
EMDAFVIEGGHSLHGRLRINGSKNSALPIMAGVLLTDQPITLRDVPDLSDIRNMVRLLGELGVAIGRESDTEARPIFCIQTIDERSSHARYDIVRTMRASVCVLGPLLARRGRARVSLPGGCAIGQRPVDIHLRGLEALGAQISLEDGDIVAEVPGGRLTGATIFLGGANGSTVLGTANVMSAATLAKGTTVIECAACEPEIVDLAGMLNAMGARIEGAGSPRLTIRGVESLSGVDHTVIPDRIEAGTFMCAAGITDGDLTLDNCPLDALMAVTTTLGSIGVSVEPIGSGDDPMRRTCRVRRSGPLTSAPITTQPHPGFPTDLQAQFMALLCIAEGNSVITEKIFPERFLHVAELQRMGAALNRQGATAVVTGVGGLRGAQVMASDLRASAGLVLAGLGAEGTTTVNRVYHIDRGYESLEDRISSVGGSVRRVKPETAPIT